MTARLIVTDHAVLRYLERVHGVDIAALRQRIAREAAAALHCPLAGATGLRKGRMRFALDGCRIVTIGPRAMMPFDPGKGRRRPGRRRGMPG